MIVLKLLAVFALLGFTLWWIRRYDQSKVANVGHGDRPVQVLGQARLGKGSSVAIIRIGDRVLTVGVTDQQVSLLQAAAAPVEEAPPAEQVALAEQLLRDSDEPAPRPTFAEALRAQLTTRRLDGPSVPSARMPHRMKH